MLSVNSTFDAGNIESKYVVFSVAMSYTGLVNTPEDAQLIYRVNAIRVKSPPGIFFFFFFAAITS